MRGKVFGIGLNKTGTTTLGVCLEMLGYRHADYSGHLLADAVAGNLEPVFARAEMFDSFEDWPWPLVYRQLDERFPDSRFILTTRRDADTWFRSLASHAERTGPTTERRLVYGHAMPHDHRAEHVARYERHAREVEAYFEGRPESFLSVCWEAGGGWAPLCAFLGQPVPREPFPHAHRSPPREQDRPADA